MSRLLISFRFTRLRLLIEFIEYASFQYNYLCERFSFSHILNAFASRFQHSRIRGLRSFWGARVSNKHSRSPFHYWNLFIRWLVFTTNSIIKAHAILYLKSRDQLLIINVIWTLYEQSIRKSPMWANTFHKTVTAPLSPQVPVRPQADHPIYGNEENPWRLWIMLWKLHI